MCSMCHFCGAGLAKYKEDNKKQENGNCFKLNNGGIIRSCKICGEKQKQESMKRDGLSPYATPMISPTSSLSSSDSSVSSYSEFSVDVNSFDRGNQEEGAADSNHKDFSFKLNGQLRNSSLETQANGIDRLGTNENSLKKISNGHDGYTVRDVEITQTSNGEGGKENGVENSSKSFNKGMENSHYFEDEMDSQIWEPPEPDDLEGSVAYNDDDDDECADGMKWGNPSSLSDFRNEGSGSYRFKEEKQRAMEEVISGKFKALVSQLLKSVGVASSGEDDENWVDIVTSLSWEAALYLKPDAFAGKPMDLDGCVKVKCIENGSRSQSQVIKGLVFKKHAAHKHMPTKYKNPRLLLIRGMLGQSSSGLSSFDSMDQEEDYLKSISGMIEMCHPNVVLVEKSVSRDVQESILKKGMTLVFDMKLHRLERVARYTGSPIVSSDSLTNQKLKQCDSFHFEKFVEEHARLSDGGKRPSKTLMFLEGCPTHLGCTILLKGTHSDELKRIKCVVQCAVVMAYHLKLETSFLVDQRAMFSTIPCTGVETVQPANQQSPNLESSNSIVPSTEDPTPITGSCTTDIPISNGFHEGSDSLSWVSNGTSPLSYEPYNPAIFTGLSSLSASLKKVIGDSFPLTSAPYQSLSSYFGFNGREPNGPISEEVPVLATLDAADHIDEDTKNKFNEDKSLDGGQPKVSSACSEAFLNMGKDGGNDEDQMKSKDDINAVSDSRSILVLMSRRNALRGTICEQSHFSHIMFYRNFDVPLGKFLRDNILNQKSQCITCGELPEAHFYYYAHHNKQLTIQVKRSPGDIHLPGEEEGKLWMWSRCGKCKPGKCISKSTKRVLISTAARGLSFGKFLELSFSHHSSSSRLSSCGHYLDRDFLYFFGLGPTVAMFRYSPVATYTVSVPPQKLEFSNSIKQEWLMKETENVYTKGMLLFTEVAGSLKKLRHEFSGSSLNLFGSAKEFSDIEEMLQQERSEFEANIQNAVIKNGNPDQAVFKLLSLNRLLWELLLESYIWDRRLNSLLSSDSTIVGTSATEKPVQEQFNLKMHGTTDGGNEESRITMENGAKVFDDGSSFKVNLTSVEPNGFPVQEIPVEGPDKEFREQDDLNACIGHEGTKTPNVTSLSPNTLSDQESMMGPNVFANLHSSDDKGLAENSSFSDQFQSDRTIPISSDLGNSESANNSNGSQRVTSPHSLLSDLESSNRWFWMPFSEIRQIYMKDLQRGYLPRFEPVSSYTSEYLPAVYQLISEESSRLHIPLGNDNHVVSDYEGELSSIIACSLALPVQAEDIDEDARRENGMASKTAEVLPSLIQIPTITSSHWSSTSSSDSDTVHSTSSSSEEWRFSSFDGLNLLESLIHPGTSHHEVSLGVEKSLGKGKYSVICICANQFRDLRNRCCPSEFDYIASLSRCRNWDAKGGKSKVFFAKTLDDRFIIKEIKKTEFESFMKFAPEYFKYMNESFELGNQTCLAKVLGIYQVITRQSKGGKEMRHDLMVMENLTFGRNITRQYDLKGALHARFNSTADGPGDVLLDQNFINDMSTSPLYVSNKAKRLLQRAVWNDTTFLNSINVMDYSLLVGVDSQRPGLVCGIIDYLRQYTWDKQLETWVKSSLVVPKNVLPTVISPKEYKKRFRKFMSIHFLSVPDHWCTERSSGPCELCGMNEEDNSPRSKSQTQWGLNGVSA